MTDLLSCSIVKHHDDDNLTIKCQDTHFVATTEGEILCKTEPADDHSPNRKCSDEELKAVISFLKDAVKTGAKRTRLSAAQKAQQALDAMSPEQREALQVMAKMKSEYGDEKMGRDMPIMR